ncbi:hypothetical protein B0H34DRAFT_267704 [Crassisporium funariophilum]|nr:hypothetical protein B0H34DRAFT_267704 [Crassisporium funariophilum]
MCWKTFGVRRRQRSNILLYLSGGVTSTFSHTLTPNFHPQYAQSIPALPTPCITMFDIPEDKNGLVLAHSIDFSLCSLYGSRHRSAYLVHGRASLEYQDISRAVNVTQSVIALPCSSSRFKLLGPLLRRFVNCDSCT